MLILGGIISFEDRRIEYLYKMLDLIISNWFNLLYSIILLAGFNRLLRYSHKKSQQKLDDYYEKEKTTHTIVVEEIVSGMIKFTRKHNTGKELCILLKNISDENILNMDGFLSLHKNGVRIKKIPFDVTMLNAGISESICQRI